MAPTDNTPAPAAPAPSAPADASADNAPVEGADDWKDLSADDTDEGLGDGQPDPAPAAPAAAPTPAAAPAVEAPKAPAPAAPAPAAPAAQPAAQPAAAPAAAPAATPTPAPVAETPEAKVAREKAAAEAETQLFNGLVEFYKIPDDMAAKLPTEPENVLPVLAARVHQSVVKGVENWIQQHLPTYLNGMKTADAAESKAKAAFYGAHPDLTAYEEQVIKAGQLYRQMNPNASPEVAIQAIGDIVRASVGLTRPAAGAAPAAPAASAPAAGWSPAGSGAAAPARAPAPTGEDNWSTLAEPD